MIAFGRLLKRIYFSGIFPLMFFSILGLQIAFISFSPDHLPDKVEAIRWLVKLLTYINLVIVLLFFPAMKKFFSKLNKLEIFILLSLAIVATLFLYHSL